MITVLPFILLLSISIPSPSETARIIDLFYGGRYRTDFPCRWMFPKQTEDLQQQALESFPWRNTRLSVIQNLFTFMQRFNCSMTSGLFANMGEPDLNGTYDGWIGSIQRQEAEISMILARLDSLPYEPVLFGPVLYESDASIISRRNYSKEVHREIASFVEDVEITVYLYVAILVIIFSVTFMVVKVVRQHLQVRKVLSWKSLYLFLKVLSECVYSLIGHIGRIFTSSRWISSRILCGSFTIFVLVLMYGYIRNVIGSNLVVNPSPQQIDSLSFFTNESWTKPVVIKKMFLPRVLASSPPNSILGQFWKVIMAHPNISILDFNLKGQVDEVKQGELMSKVFEVMHSVNNCTRALIGPKYFMSLFIKIGCLLEPKLCSHIHVTKETFAPGTFHVLMSHGIDPYLRRGVDYLFRTISETGIIAGILQTLDSTMTMFVPNMKHGREALECQRMKWSSPNEDEWRPFKMVDLGKVFMVWMVGVIIAIFVHVFVKITTFVRSKM